MKSIKVYLICSLAIFFTTNLSAQKCPKIRVCSSDTVISIVEYKELQKDADFGKQQATQLQKPDIDKFLNIQDTTIFGSKFQRFTLQSIPIRSRDFYSLIENIHDLNNLLANTENMNVAQLRNLKNNLVNAKTKIDLINSFATLEKRKITDFLTEPQKQYFRQLVTRYNELNEMLNFNTNGGGNEN